MTNTDTRATYTPGPWRIGRFERIEPVNEGAVVATVSGGRSITRGTLPEAERLANARLIAAAPELLEALEAARDALHEHECVHSATLLADAAIARARGEE